MRRTTRAAVVDAAVRTVRGANRTERLPCL